MQGGTDAPASPGASSRSARPPLPPLPSELATEAFREAWSEWLQHRRDIGHPVRPVGAKAAFGRLVPYGPERAAAVIRESIANGWRGLFPERDAGGNGRNREPEDDDRAVTKRALDLWEKQKADEAERGIRAHA